MGSEKHVKSKKKHCSRKKSGTVIGVFLLLLVIAAGAAAWLYISNLAYRSCTVEAGVEVSASDFIKDGDPLAFFTEDSQPFDITVPGEYRVRVQSGCFSHRATLYIQDTIPPTVQPATAYLLPGETCSPEDLLGHVSDVTQVTATFAKEPDFSLFGSQKADVIVTDAGGNSTTVSSEIFISRVRYELAWEAGSLPPAAEDFLLSGSSASFITDVESLNLNTVANYEISISVDGEEYASVLHVVDTVPPKAEVQDISGFMLVERRAEDFVISVDDVTAVTAAFVEEPDLTLEGTQELELSLTDEGGNSVLLPVTLTLYPDTEPPEIAGIHDLALLIGESLAYRKGLRVTDNCPEGLNLEIDSSGVNLNQEGVYQAVYTATDLAGNSTTATITVTVRPWEHSEDELNSLADGVLARIINPNMSQRDILDAIYNYITSNVLYIDHSEKGNWSQAAYEGLSQHRGDCYVFACTAKLLLTRAGIENMDIGKSDEYSNHYWNLVDIGDGWYHFDCTPRVDHPRIFLWTDAQLQTYSNNHHHSHDYDRSLFPEIN